MRLSYWVDAAVVGLGVVPDFRGWCAFTTRRDVTGVKSAIPLWWDCLFVFSELSSDDLVQRCAGSRDSAAWAEFIRRFQPVIASAVLRTARSWHEPSRDQLDDLIQETFLKLCENESRMLRSFRSRHKDSIYGYLKVVAANVVRDHFKSVMATKRGAAQTDTIEKDLPANSSGAQFDGAAEVLRGLELDYIDRIVIKVTAGKDQQRNRAIFWLRYRLGLTASEIGSIPGIGLSTEGVESVLLRLLNMIRSHVKGGTSD